MKKGKFIVFLLLGCFLLGFVMFKPSNEQIPIGERYVNELLADAARFFKKKYNVHPMGTHVSMPGGPVRVLGLDFQLRKPLPKGEARKMLIDCAEEFLSMINTNEKIRPHLIHTPFNFEDIMLTFFIRDVKGERIYDPELAVVAFHKGQLRYLTLEESSWFNVKSRVIESYEEARKLLENN